MAIELDYNGKKYEENIDAYLRGNWDGKVGGKTPLERAWMASPHLPLARRVFEPGAAAGHDSRALQALGYSVQPTDYIQGFVDVLKDGGFPNAHLWNGKKDPLPEGFDAIWLNAVLVHFSPDESLDLFKRTSLALQRERIIFMSVLRGEGRERSFNGRWADPADRFEREFQYYSPDSLNTLLVAASVRILAQDEVVSSPQATWIQVVGQFS